MGTIERVCGLEKNGITAGCLYDARRLVVRLYVLRDAKKWRMLKDTALKIETITIRLN